MKGFMIFLSVICAGITAGHVTSPWVLIPAFILCAFAGAGSGVVADMIEDHFNL